MEPDRGLFVNVGYPVIGLEKFRGKRMLRANGT
jgi:hypothetical protein